MPAIVALKFASGFAKGQYERHRLTIESSGDLDRIRSEQTQSVFVISENAIEGLLLFGDVVEDLGRKHPKGGLNRRMLSHRKIPLIVGTYTEPGRVVQGVDALLMGAVEAADTNIYFVAVADTIFRMLDPGEEHVGSGKAPSVGEAFKDWILSNPENKLTDEERAKIPLVGTSSDIELVRAMIKVAAQCDFPVLILGETGTGKELVASAIHRLSRRSKKGELLAINCSAIASELLESELFGIIGRTVTGVSETQLGLWVKAGKGTLFLDEIGEFSLDHQSKILRALQEGKVRPVGGKDEVRVEARIIAATNRDLHGMMRAEKFRDDLYYRLNSLPIYIPPLRKHPEDIRELALHFWREATEDENAKLSSDLLDELQRYRWSGNGRALGTMMQRLSALTRNRSKVTVNDVRILHDYEAHFEAMSKEPTLHDDALLRQLRLDHLKQVISDLRRLDDGCRALRAVQDSREGMTSLLTMLFPTFIAELESLSGQVNRFRSVETPDSIFRLLDKVKDFMARVSVDSGSVDECWETIVAQKYNETYKHLLEEIGRILK